MKRWRDEPTEESFWGVVLAYAGVKFKTYSGLPFCYEIKKGRNGEYTKELWIDRREKSKSLAWSSVLLALGNIKGEVVDRPKALGDIRGVTYIYGMFYRFGLIDVPDEVKEMYCHSAVRKEQCAGTSSITQSAESARRIDVLCGDEGKKASVKLDEILIYWERKLPTLFPKIFLRWHRITSLTFRIRVCCRRDGRLSRRMSWTSRCFRPCRSLPVFAGLSIMAYAVFCLRAPYLTAVQAAGKYKETRNGAFVEAGLNFTISFISVFKFGLIGVTLGTLAANVFRTIQYAVFISQKMLPHRSIWEFIKRCVWLLANVVIIYVVLQIIPHGSILSWCKWITIGICDFVIAMTVTGIMSIVFYRKDLFRSFKVVKRMMKK